PNVGPLGVLTGHAVSIVLYLFLFLRYKVQFPEYFKYLIFGSLLFASTIVMSQLANYDRLGFGLAQLRYAFVPFYWIFGLLAGVVDAKIFNSKKRNFFFYFAAIFILAQVPLVLLQVMGFDSLLWIAEKARDWTGILRVVGTVQNPNTLGIITVLCIVIFAHFSKSKSFWSKVLIGVSVLIVLATGSRTSLIILLFLPVIFISKEQLMSKKLIYALLITIGFLVVFYLVLIYLEEHLPYMSQLLNIIRGKSIHTLDTRIGHWENISELYFSSSFKNILFGFGPGYFTVLDNSYYYIIFNYGIASIIVFLFFISFLFLFGKRQSSKIPR